LGFYVIFTFYMGGGAGAGIATSNHVYDCPTWACVEQLRNASDESHKVIRIRVTEKPFGGALPASGILRFRAIIDEVRG
jgi:hypothetical protein